MVADEAPTLPQAGTVPVLAALGSLIASIAGDRAAHRITLT